MRRRRSLAPARPLRGTVRVPGDKSISHRALILAGLASSPTASGSCASRILNLNTGDDVRATADALGALGVPIAWAESAPEVEVEGRGRSGLREAEAVIDARNSGTTLRTLLGVCAGLEGLTVLTGDASLRRRPMLRVVAPLRQMGATIDGPAHGDRAPLSVRGGPLRGIDIELPVASAQVKTALLLAGLAASGTTEIIEPALSRDHTERMLEAAGVKLVREGRAVAVAGGQEVQPLDRTIPGDISSAMFLIAAALLVEGSDLTIAGVGLNPTRTAALDVLKEMGADIEIEIAAEEGGEPVGHVRVKASSLRAVDIGGAVVPSLIDEVPVLAIVAARAEGETRISGAGELRVKESDRIEAIVRGLRAMGAEAEPLPDGLIVHGPASLGGARVDPQGDHRCALAFAVAGLVAEGKVSVDGWSCVDTSFPEFLDVLSQARAE